MTTYFTYITSIHKHLNSSWAFISLRSWLVSNAQLLLTNIVFEIFLTQFTSIYIKFKVVHVIIYKIFMISSWILQFIIIFRKLRSLLSLLCFFFFCSPVIINKEANNTRTLNKYLQSDFLGFCLIYQWWIMWLYSDSFIYFYILMPCSSL